MCARAYVCVSTHARVCLARACVHVCCAHAHAYVCVNARACVRVCARTRVPLTGRHHHHEMLETGRMILPATGFEPGTC